MLKEQKKVITHRLVWFLLLIFFLLFTIFFRLPHKELTILDDACSLDSYYEYSDSSACSMRVTFNQPLESCYITIVFYDSDGNVLDEVSETFYGPGETLTNSYISVDGHMDSYEIIDYEATFPNDFSVFMLKIYLGGFLIIIAFVFSIVALLVNYKKYQINGHSIIVYAGFYHHYIKVDGNIVDENNTAFSLAPIVLSSTVDNEEIKATINPSNRITVKYQNVLIRPQK